MRAVGAGAALRPGYRAAGAVGGINEGSAPAGVWCLPGILGLGGAVIVAGVAAAGCICPVGQSRREEVSTTTVALRRGRELKLIPKRLVPIFWRLLPIGTVFLSVYWANWLSISGQRELAREAAAGPRGASQGASQGGGDGTRGASQK